MRRLALDLLRAFGIGTAFVFAIVFLSAVLTEAKAGEREPRYRPPSSLERTAVRIERRLAASRPVRVKVQETPNRKPLPGFERQVCRDDPKDDRLLICEPKKKTQ